MRHCGAHQLFCLANSAFAKPFRVQWVLLAHVAAGFPLCCAAQNYQAKRIENTSVRDEPFEFRLGSGEVRSTHWWQQGSPLHCRFPWRSLLPVPCIAPFCPLRAALPGTQAACRAAPLPQHATRSTPSLTILSSPPASHTPPWQVIPAFDEAVAGMRTGGVRRVEVLGELPQLSYPRDPKERYVSRAK